MFNKELLTLNICFIYPYLHLPLRPVNSQGTLLWLGSPAARTPTFSLPQPTLQTCQLPGDSAVATTSSCLIVYQHLPVLPVKMGRSRGYKSPSTVKRDMFRKTLYNLQRKSSELEHKIMKFRTENILYLLKFLQWNYQMSHLLNSNRKFIKVKNLLMFLCRVIGTIQPLIARTYVRHLNPAVLLKHLILTITKCRHYLPYIIYWMQNLRN